jgi:large conductance mechanosensitive channel
MQGFRKFILRGNVVDLAVAVVIGAAFGSVVQALVKDLITPLIGAFGGVPDFSALFFTVNQSKFLIGDFINAVLSFLLLAAVVYYLVVLPVSKLIEQFSPPPPAATRPCPFCLSKIPAKARRCAFCTSDVEDKVQAVIDQMTGA